MSAVERLARPRRIKVAHRRRWKCSTGSRLYANDNPYRYTDPDGRCTFLQTTPCITTDEVANTGAPTVKDANAMVSTNPDDRVAAAHSAMQYFGIKPAAGTLTINYITKMDPQEYGDIKWDVQNPGHGIIELGPSAYKSWAHLGSTLGHEVEVHWNKQMLQCLCNAIDSHQHDQWEMTAYKYNIDSAQRFGNSAQDVKEFQILYNEYKYDLEHAPDEIFTQ